MAEILDINSLLRDRKIAELLAKDSGRLYCNPADRHRFDWLPDGKVSTSTVMEEGKAYAIDVQALRKLIAPEPMNLRLEDFRK